MADILPLLEQAFLPLAINIAIAMLILHSALIIINGIRRIFH